MLTPPSVIKAMVHQILLEVQFSTFSLELSLTLYTKTKDTDILGSSNSTPRYAHDRKKYMCEPRKYIQ